MSMYQAGRPESSMCMMNISLEFSNTSIYLDGVAVVCSTAQMPNNHSGIIFGQRSILDILVYTTEPRRTMLCARNPGSDSCLREDTYKSLCEYACRRGRVDASGIGIWDD